MCIIVSNPKSHILESFYKYESNWENFEEYKQNPGIFRLTSDQEEIFFNFHAYYFLIKQKLLPTRTEKFRYHFPTEEELEKYFEENWENQMNLMKTWYKNQQFFQEIMKQNPLKPREYLNLREVESLA